MLRNITLGLVAAAAVATAALAPTTASASPNPKFFFKHGHHHNHHNHWHKPYFGSYAYYGGGGCYVRRLVPTPWGYRYRVVNRCIF